MLRKRELDRVLVAYLCQPVYGNSFDLRSKIVHLCILPLINDLPGMRDLLLCLFSDADVTILINVAHVEIRIVIIVIVWRLRIVTVDLLFILAEYLQLAVRVCS